MRKKIRDLKDFIFYEDEEMDLKNDIKERMEEEFYPLVDRIRENIEEYTALDEQSRLAWVRKELGE